MCEKVVCLTIASQFKESSRNALGVLFSVPKSSPHSSMKMHLFEFERVQMTSYM